MTAAKKDSKNIMAKSLRTSILKNIAEGDNLLSLPSSLAKVIEVINDENASIDSLATAIHRDPSLTATIIRMANTPYYGRMTRCSSLSDAVMTLGSLTMKSIALTATTLNPKNIENECGIDPEKFVANSLTVATLAREIACAIGYPKPEDALTAGLLHDIGVLYFIGNHSEAYSEVNLKAVGGEDILACELEIFEIEHLEVGKALMRGWHLPEIICKCVGSHHQVESANDTMLTSDEDETLIRVIQLAVAIAGDSYLQKRRKLDFDLESVKVLSASLEISDLRLGEIVSASLKESTELASGFGMDESLTEEIMSTANKKLGQYLNELQRLMRDREELSVKILSEERRKGVAESKIAIIATLSHHINNSAMVAMGKAEALSIILQRQLSDSAYTPIAKDLQTIVDSVADIKVALEEMSKVADSDIMAVHDKNKTLDLEELIKKSVRLENSGLLLQK